MLYKIIGLTLIFAFILVYIKNSAEQFFAPILVCASVVIISSLLTYAIDFFEFFEQISESTFLDKKVIKSVVKVMGISYLVEFAVSIVEDMQIKSLSDKLVFGGKIIIFSICLPIIKQIIDLLVDFF